MDSPRESSDEWDDDADNAELIAAQNRTVDPGGSMSVDDPGDVEEFAHEDAPPATLPADADDDFSDLEDGEDDDSDLDGDLDDE